MLALGLGTLFALAGCQSSTQSSAGSYKAFTCAKCMTTWIHDGQVLNKVTSSKSNECPDCEKAAAGHMNRAVVPGGHECKNCNGDMEQCIVHEIH